MHRTGNSECNTTNSSTISLGLIGDQENVNLVYITNELYTMEANRRMIMFSERLRVEIQTIGLFKITKMRGQLGLYLNVKLVYSFIQD